MHDPSQDPMAPPDPVLPEPSTDYPTGATGELFHDIVNVCQRETKAPLSLCIQAALGVGAFVQQGLVEVESPSGHITPATLLLFGVLEPAAGKSSVMDKFTAPINKFIEAQTKKRQKSEQDYSREKANWEKTRKNLESKLSKANAKAEIQVAEAELKEQQEKGEAGTGAEPEADAGNTKYQEAMDQVKVIEAALKRHSKETPQPPSSIGLGILSEATPAAISKSIKDERIQSLAIVSAEAEEFFGKGIKNQSSLLNKGFSGEKTSKHLATRGDESHNIPITGLVFGQPYIMEKALGGDNNRMRATGTLSRCLFTYPPSDVGFQYDSISQYRDLPLILRSDGPGIEKRYRQWVSKRLHRNVKQFESGDTSRQRLTLSRGALDMWYRGRAELDIQLRAGGRYGEFRDHGSRLPEQWLRVASVIHGYNQREDEEVSARTMNLAIGLVNSFSTEFQRVFRQTSQEEQDAMKLLNWINDKRAQSYQYVGKSLAATSSPLRSASRLNNAIQVLCQNQQISIREVPCYNNQGRPTKPMTIIDLFPFHEFNPQNFDSAIQHARMLNNR